MRKAWTSLELLRNGRDVSFSESGENVFEKCVADPFQLEQVFRNLLENAVSACDDPVKIEVTYEQINDQVEGGLRVVVNLRH